MKAMDNLNLQNVYIQNVTVQLHSGINNRNQGHNV